MLYSSVLTLLQTCANVENLRGSLWYAKRSRRNALRRCKGLIFNTLRKYASRGSAISRKETCNVLFCTKRFPQGFHSVLDCRKLRKPFRKDPLSSQNEEISDGNIGVTQKQIGDALSNRSRSSQNSRGKEKQGAQKRQNAVNCDPHNPKRQQNQPNKGIEHECKQGKRPTEEKQDAPK
jgi:hypothetical protein